MTYSLSSARKRMVAKAAAKERVEEARVQRRGVSPAAARIMLETVQEHQPPIGEEMEEREQDQKEDMVSGKEQAKVEEKLRPEVAIIAASLATSPETAVEKEEAKACTMSKTGSRQVKEMIFALS